MGWYTYFKLLEKYNGDLTKATAEEMDDAAKSNPNTPPAALELAKRKYREEHPSKWLKEVCPICGKVYEYLPTSDCPQPRTCGKFDCLQEANKRGLLK